MEIYLVRHGETGGNMAHRHQAEHTPLSVRGQQQAKAVAEVIKRYEPTHLLSSSLVRAIETASIIGDACDLPMETSPTFIELVRPDHLYGHYHRSMRSLWFYLRWYLGNGAAHEREEESYQVFRERFIAAKHELSQYPEDARVVVVTHSVFMGLFLEHLCRDKAVSPLVAVRAFYRILTMPNTHIEPIRFDTGSQPDVCAWSKSG